MDPTQRLGCDEMGGYGPLKEHLFYEEIKWESLPQDTPPRLLPYLPATSVDEPGFWGDSQVHS